MPKFTPFQEINHTEEDKDLTLEAEGQMLESRKQSAALNIVHS